MKKLMMIGVWALLASQNIFAVQGYDAYEMQNLKDEVKFVSDQLLLEQGIDPLTAQCRTITRCTTDFKGNVTCSAELVCDL